MTFVRMAFFPAATAAHFAELADLMRDTPPPPERLLFAAGPRAGGWQVVQVWRAKADLDRFNAEVFLPALGRLTKGFPRPPEVTDFEADLLDGHGLP